MSNKSYQEYLKSDHWQYWRNRKKKDGFCVVCKKKNNLEVHHLKYSDLYDITNKDLVVLCRRCHQLTHDMMQAGELKFKKGEYKLNTILKTLKPIVNNKNRLNKERYRLSIEVADDEFKKIKEYCTKKNLTYRQLILLATVNR